MSGFSAINTGLSGLNAARRALDVLGQNVVNANTPNYSRQRVDVSAMGAPTGAALFTGSTNVTLGGVSIDTVTRIRDAFLEGTRAAAGARWNALSERESALTGVEQLLSEPGDAGLQSVLDDFLTSWHDLAQRPADSSAGAVILQRGQAVAQQLNYVANGIVERWDTARETLSNAVMEANQAASDLATLNGRIRENQAGGRPANELLDRRDELVRMLADLVGGSAVPAEDGVVSVTVNGIAIVAETVAKPFTLVGTTNFAEASEDPPRLLWNDMTVPVASGRAAGLLSVLGSDFPAAGQQVDAVAATLIQAVNAVHVEGYTLTGDAGEDFFSGTNGLDIQVALTSPDQLAPSALPGAVDGSVAQRLGDLIDDRNVVALLDVSGPSVLWRDFSAGLGVKVQSVERALEVQESVLTTAEAAVEADAGVNIDEEMASMLLFQRAYEASARVITTADQMLDVLVNRTGTVGR